MAIDASTGATVKWVLILPLKGGEAAKSRLRGGPELARAIALDCLDAVLACPDVRRVLVVTADRATAGDAAAAGAVVVPESRPGSGLVAAVRDGLASAGASAEGGARAEAEGDPRAGVGGRERGLPVAVLLGDLPALRPTDLSAGLRAAAAALAAAPTAPMAALPDAEGSGTVLLTGRAARDLDPAFGPGSLAEHRRRGAVPVLLDDMAPDADPARLRHDVDTPSDLCIALALGVGPRTSAMFEQARSAS